MSALSDLLRQVQQKDPQLAADLAAEVKALSGRRAFGLNFERHTPETVELPGRPIRKGDKVRFLPDRGAVPDRTDQRLWRVSLIQPSGDALSAQLIAQAENSEGTFDTATRSVDDLVVVAEFRDPIYPGLRSTGKIERGGDKPFHAVINAENFHALQALLYAHEGGVDAIYIDPPYNNGKKDWRYNNDYVDSEDDYRHSKWLAFMERRLRLAKRLLNPAESVLIVAIDDREVHRLGLLLEQVFDESKVQMVTTVTNPRGKYRDGEFSRCDEYLFFVSIGRAAVVGEPDADYSAGASVPWRTLRRSDIDSARGTGKGGPSQFFPIYVDNTTRRIRSLGVALAPGIDRTAIVAPDGCTAVFPVRDDGTEMNWGLTAGSLQALLGRGYVRVGRHAPQKPQQYEISYLTTGRIADISEGRATVVGSDETGAVLANYLTHKMKMPLSNWVRDSHNAETQGTAMVKSLLGEKRFPFPKSLYAVEDSLGHFIANRPDALIIDFFAGSGTTAHAVMRLNRRDQGRRRCIIVTNNEVAEGEQAALRERGLRPGDPEWESHGICDHVTQPRIEAAVTGHRPGGGPLSGEYKYTDPFPMSEGFAENVEFLTLTYEAPRSVAHNRSFDAVAPLLWLKAGAQGRRIDHVLEAFDVADTYGVLFDLDHSRGFLEAIRDAVSVLTAFVVTDDDRRYQMVCAELPRRVEPVRLYESYLTNFTINTGRE